MRSVRTIPVLKNIPVIVRVAMNVPVENGVVMNDYRLRRAVPTLTFLSSRGARVILVSHIGEKGTETLEPVAKALGKRIPRVSFFPETIGPRVRDAIRAMVPGDVLVLENLRRDKREQANDLSFAKELAMLGDVFVEDSFDTCHRKHASIVSLPKLLPSYAGLQLEDEVTELRLALKPKHPSLAVIGGAKFSTKEGLLSLLLSTYDKLFVGGALANDFLKAKGHEVGKSLVSAGDTSGIQALLADEKLVLPLDVVVVPASVIGTPEQQTKARVVSVEGVRPDESILDHGPATEALLTSLAKDAKTILWNGPLGNYENGFVSGTDAFARAVAKSGARSVVGGGDTVASIESLGLLPKFSFVSTGGGAMLDFLADGSLPGIDALDNTHLSS